MNKKLCTHSTLGIIIDVKDRGIDTPSTVIFSYRVNGETYQRKESLKYRNEWIKLGPIPIGQRKIPRIDVIIGNQVEVSYSPDDPSKAYITNNRNIRK